MIMLIIIMLIIIMIMLINIMLIIIKRGNIMLHILIDFIVA